MQVFSQGQTVLLFRGAKGNNRLAANPKSTPNPGVRVVIARISLTALCLVLCQIVAFAAEPEADWVRVTPNAGWQPRDSQGEVVFDNKLWIFGGWFDSYQAPPRDVWNSADGITWIKVTAKPLEAQRPADDGHVPGPDVADGGLVQRAAAGALRQQ